MKYLKLFEDYDDPLFTEISLDEYQYKVSGYDGHDEDWDESGYIFSNWEAFEERETDMIIESIPLHYKYKFNINRDYIEDCPKSEMYILNQLGRVRMMITKLKDEWFYIYDVNEDRHNVTICYKCDQIDGLEEYLKTVKFI